MDAWIDVHHRSGTRFSLASSCMQWNLVIRWHSSIVLLRTFWSSGADEMMSFIIMGISTVTLCTPAAKVPSGADALGACPWAFA